MTKILDADKIVDIMVIEENICPTKVERELLKIAIVRGAMAVVDSNLKSISKLKRNWLNKLIRWRR